MARHPSQSSSSYAFSALLVYVTTFLSTPYLSAQNLPPPSRTMYKCKAQGTTTYSDSPCLGGTRLEIEPTRGVSKISGTERTGNDVSHERQREAFAEGLRPLTGMDAKQFAVATRRAPLSVAAKQECQQLDQAMPLLENEERNTAQPLLRDVQMRLLQMRQRFRDLRC